MYFTIVFCLLCCECKKFERVGFQEAIRPKRRRGRVGEEGGEGEREKRESRRKWIPDFDRSLKGQFQRCLLWNYLKQS